MRGVLVVLALVVACAPSADKDGRLEAPAPDAMKADAAALDAPEPDALPDAAPPSDAPPDTWCGEQGLKCCPGRICRSATCVLLGEWKYPDAGTDPRIYQCAERCGYSGELCCPEIPDARPACPFDETCTAIDYPAVTAYMCRRGP